MFQLYSFIICHVLENIDKKYEMTFVDIDELVMAFKRNNNNDLFVSRAKQKKRNRICRYENIEKNNNEIAIAKDHFWFC